MKETDAKKPFIFSEDHVANNVQELVPLCEHFDLDAKRYLENGDLERWLEYIGEFKLLEKVKRIRVDPAIVDPARKSEVKLKKFIKVCKNNNFIRNKITLESIRWIAASILIPVLLYFSQQLIQDKISEREKERTKIDEQVKKEVARNEYQQKALDTYIDSVTNLLKEEKPPSSPSTGKDASSSNKEVKEKAKESEEKAKETFKTIARAKTLTTLYLLYLDRERRTLLIAFLRDANFLARKDESKYNKINEYLVKSIDKIAVENTKIIKAKEEAENTTDIKKIRLSLLQILSSYQPNLLSILKVDKLEEKNDLKGLKNYFPKTGECDTIKDCILLSLKLVDKFRSDADVLRGKENLVKSIDKIAAENNKIIKKINAAKEEAEKDRTDVKTLRRSLLQILFSYQPDLLKILKVQKLGETQDLEALKDKFPKTRECDNIKNCILLSLKLVDKLENVNPLLENIELGGVKFNGIDLHDAILNGAKLAGSDLKNSNLTRAELNGASLGQSILNDSFLIQTSLKRAVLSKTDLRNANLDSADLTGANLRKADLRDAILYNATLLDKEKISNPKLADFAGADLRGAKFSSPNDSCNTGDINKPKEKCKNYLSSYKDKKKPDASCPDCASFKDALYNEKTKFPPGFDPIKDPKQLGMLKIAPKENLAEADLSGADLSGADLSGANLSGANLSNTNLRGTILIGAKLKGTKFEKAVYDDTTKWPTTILGFTFDPKPKKAIKITPNTDIKDQDLSNLNLQGFDLKQLNLRKAKLNNTDLRDSDLTGADLSGANLQFARIDANALDKAYLCNTTLPNGNLSTINCDTEKPKVSRFAWIGDTLGRFMNFIFFK